VCVTFAGACSSGHSSSDATTTTSAGPATRDQYVAAAAEGVRSDPDKPKGITDAQIMCVSRALVDGIGVARLRAAGVTTGDLASAGYTFPSSLSAALPAPARLAFGARLQTCHQGALLAPQISSAFLGPDNPTTPAENQCIAAEFDDPARRLLNADLVLLSAPAPDDAAALAGVALACLHLGARTAAAGKVALTAAEKSCIDRTASADAPLRAGVASALLDPDALPAATRAFQVVLAKCLPGDRARRLAGMPPPILAA